MSSQVPIQACKRSLSSSGFHLSRSGCQYSRSAYKPRLPCTTATAYFSSKVETGIRRGSGNFESATQPEIAEDAFSIQATMQEAKDRWALGEADFAPIVFPKGRPEIVTLVKQLQRIRIADGQSGNGNTRDDRRFSRDDRRFPQDDRRSSDDRQTRIIMDLHKRSLQDKNKDSSSSTWTPISPPDSLRPPRNRDTENMPLWMKHKLTIKEKLLGKAWNPQRKLSRQAMDEVRYLRKQFPDEWTTGKLAKHFNVASESIARMLRSDFRPSPERAVEQDMIRHAKKKENISNFVEKIKADRHALYLERKAEREKAMMQGKNTTGRIKLGAPKRKFESE